MDAKITKANDDTLGNRPESVPVNMASAWADKEVSTGPLKGFGLGAGVRFVGSSYGDNGDTYLTPGVTLFDAEMHYEFRGLQFSVNASNLFNKTYVAICQGETSCYYGLKRNVRGKMTYRW